MTRERPQPGVTAAALDALWDFNDPRTSEARFRRFLRRVNGSPPANLDAEARTQLARAQALQSKFRSAHRTLDALAPTLPRLAPRAKVRYLLERGRVWNSAGARRRALPLFLAAWRSARRSREDALAIDAAHMVALVSSGPRQRAWNARALRLAERSRDRRAHRWRASLLNNIGWNEFGAGAYRDALRSFRRAVIYRRRQNDPAGTRIARWCVAKTLRMMGRPSDALRVQRRLLGEWRRARHPDGYVFEELGECLLALERPREARPFFRAAYAELSKNPWLRAKESRRLERLVRLRRF